MTTQRMSVPIVIAGALQKYAWGDEEFIPHLLGLESDGPQAELWFGSHPLAPAIAELSGRQQPLDSLIAADPTALLGRVARYGQLPYLLKILAAARPLSLQVHPSREQAEAGFAAEEAQGLSRSAPERTYRDPHHKPELLVALTPFRALAGFRPLELIRGELQKNPELSGLSSQALDSPAGLKAWVSAVFETPKERLRERLGALLERLHQRDLRGELDPDDAGAWALAARRALGETTASDPGLVFVYLLNRVRLEPGQGLYVSAGMPHAYFEGAGVEVMASSDNVLRGGLTPKHVEVNEFLRVVDFRSSRAPVLLPEGGDGEQCYRTPAEEFELCRLELGPAADKGELSAEGPETWLVIDCQEGPIKVDTEGGHVEIGRGRACLLPDATRYRITSRGAATLFRVKVPSVQTSGSFRGRTPRPLRFGTSGLRGLVTDLTDLEVYLAIRGFVDYLRSVGDLDERNVVALAGDLRSSTDSPERSILRAVVRALNDAGLSSEYHGRIPTPALTYYGITQAMPSIMVTGSHIPFDRNGIKLNRSQGEVLKADEAGILVCIDRWRKDEYRRSPETSLFDHDGMFKPGVRPQLPAPSPCAAAAYRRRYLDFFPATCLGGLRLLFFEHSAVGRDLLREILSELGAEVIAAGRAEQFVAIDTEALGTDTLEAISQIANATVERVGPIDAVVSTDGDSDRPLLLAPVGSGGWTFVSGDRLGILVADFLEADAVAVAVSATDAVERHLAPRKVMVTRTRIGSPYVIFALREMAGQRRVGWESNGGFLTGTALTLNGRSLLALPTRDALLPLVAALAAAKRRGIGLDRLVAELPRRFTASGLLDQVEPALAKSIIAWISPAADRIVRVKYQGESILCQSSAGEAWEASDVACAELTELRSRLQGLFAPGYGPSELTVLDRTDGVRLTFADGGTVHLRASGNAPQMRVYVVADDPARAEDLVNWALEEPGGLLALLRRKVSNGSIR